MAKAKGKSKNKAAFVKALKKKEATVEKRGGPKTQGEKNLEKLISKTTGKPYKGKR